ncbi:hypothetical protein YC2023_098422 [Brassica napus]
MLSHRIIVALCLAAAIDAVEDPYPTQHTLIGWFPSHIHHQIAFCSLQVSYEHLSRIAQLLKACGTTPATPTWKLLNKTPEAYGEEVSEQTPSRDGVDITTKLPLTATGKRKSVRFECDFDQFYLYIGLGCHYYGNERAQACKAKIKLLTRTDTVVVEKDTTENNEVRVVEETDAVVVENGALSSDASSGKGITPEKQTENVKNVEAGKTVEWNNRDETLAPTTNDLVEKIKEKEDIEEEEDKWLDVSPTKQ